MGGGEGSKSKTMNLEAKQDDGPRDEENTLGNMSGDEQPKDDHQISKKKKGVQHTINMDVLNNEQLLTKQGWERVPQPWTYTKAKQYVTWTYINRHWLASKLAPMTAHNVAFWSVCQH